MGAEINKNMKIQMTYNVDTRYEIPPLSVRFAIHPYQTLISGSQLNYKMYINIFSATNTAQFVRMDVTIRTFMRMPNAFFVICLLSTDKTKRKVNARLGLKRITHEE